MSGGEPKMKTRIQIITILLTAVVLFAGVNVQAQSRQQQEGVELLKAFNDALAGSLEHVLPTVVNIRSEKRQEVVNPFQGTPFEDLLPWRGRSGRALSLGSGVIVDGAKGYILTNNHVVEDADQIFVDFFGADGRHEEFEAEAFTDPKTELALVRIKDLRGVVLPQAKLGDSETLRVGHIVMAIGNPFQKLQSVSKGIVSALGRQEFSPQFQRTIYQDFIQTDAAINQGNSGGPVVNIYGEVVGISTFIYSTSAGAQGVGFAIPINLAKPVIEQLIASGRVVRPFLGVFMSNVREMERDKIDAMGMPDPRGVIVQSLIPGSPAEKAGIQPFDILLEFEGEAIENSRGLQQQVLQKKIGDRVRLKIWRPSEKKEMTVRVTLEEQPDDTTRVASVTAPSDGDKRLGMSLRPLTREQADRLEISDAKGLLVTSVDENSQAAREGIQPNDVLLKAKWQDISTIQELDRIMDDLKKEGSKKILLVMLRRSTQFLVVLDLEQPE